MSTKKTTAKKPAKGSTASKKSGAASKTVKKKLLSHAEREYLRAKLLRRR